MRSGATCLAFAQLAWRQDRYHHGLVKRPGTRWASTGWSICSTFPTPTLKEAGVQDHFSLGVAHMADAVAARSRKTSARDPGTCEESRLAGEMAIPPSSISSIRT